MTARGPVLVQCAKRVTSAPPLAHSKRHDSRSAQRAPKNHHATPSRTKSAATLGPIDTPPRSTGGCHAQQQPGGCDFLSQPVRREAVEHPVRGKAADRSVGEERASHPPGRPQPTPAIRTEARRSDPTSRRAAPARSRRTTRSSPRTAPPQSRWLGRRPSPNPACE